MATMQITQVSSSGTNAIDSLLSGVRWSGSSVTYSFPVAGSSFLTDYSTSQEPWHGFKPLTSSMMSGVRQALSQWAAVANITFTEVTEPSSSGVLRFGQSSVPSTAWGYYPYTDESAGDVWYGYQYDYTNPHWDTYSNYDYYSSLHEIGHALGLKHPGQYSSDDEGPYAATSIDCLSYSVMSYLSYAGAGMNTYPGTTSYPQTPMLDDIMALQYMYGANYNYNSGNTTYTFSPSDTTIFRTIWDGNGTDTYDASSYTTGVDIQLTPGSWSTLGSSQLADLGDGVKAAGSVANAYLYNNDTRSLIENAIGGSGDDSLRGNAGNNTLTGKGGSDQLWGGSGGNDSLVDDSGENMFWWTAGEGNDWVGSYGKGSALNLYGFAYADRQFGFLSDGSFWIAKSGGSDYVTISNWQNLNTANRLQSFVFSDSGTSKAYAYNAGYNIEVLLSSSAYRLANVHSLECIDTGSARLGGTSGNDTIKGGSGNDELWGGSGGSDTLTGGAGSDVYWFTTDSGRSTITSASNNSSDTVRFYTGFQPSSMSVYLSGNDLHITSGSTEAVLQGWAYGGSYKLNNFYFDQTGSAYQVQLNSSGSGQFVRV